MLALVMRLFMMLAQALMRLAYVLGQLLGMLLLAILARARTSIAAAWANRKHPNAAASAPGTSVKAEEPIAPASVMTRVLGRSEQHATTDDKGVTVKFRPRPAFRARAQR
jgi:hypothetical protein